MANEMIIEKDIQKELTTNVQHANEIVIKTNDDYQGAGEFLKGLKGLQKKIGDFMKPIVQSAHQNWKMAKDRENSLLDPVSKAESVVKSKMLTYQQEQERIRLEAERKAQEAARREEERKRKALEERAANAEKMGKTEKAEDLREQAEEVFIPVPIIPSQIEKVEGIKTMKVWKFEIVDVTLIERDLLMPDMTQIGAIVRATKGTRQIPGIRIYSEDVIAAGRG